MSEYIHVCEKCDKTTRECKCLVPQWVREEQ